MFIDQLTIYGFIAPEERNVCRALLRSSGAWTGVIDVAINILLLRSLTRLVAALQRGTSVVNIVLNNLTTELSMRRGAPPKMKSSLT